MNIVKGPSPLTGEQVGTNAQESSTDGILGMGDPRENSAILEEFPGLHQRDMGSDVMELPVEWKGGSSEKVLHLNADGAVNVRYYVVVLVVESSSFEWDCERQERKERSLLAISPEPIPTHEQLVNWSTSTQAEGIQISLGRVTEDRFQTSRWKVPRPDRLTEIRRELECLALTHRWLRETDLRNCTLSFREIDKMRVDGAFVDLEKNIPQGQYLSTIKKCLNEVLEYGGSFGARDLYPLKEQSDEQEEDDGEEEHGEPRYGPRVPLVVNVEGLADE
ncbi:hypothetical protein BDM02DRAFT_3132520 [Thelephora ganbajun]|uniref:Uncharacterized protein n=1 Tax=Thelephora ganbajun TaxID=370292 RepID=A0ACB6Z0U3_THEGA|nr:hypothetical protein BDM02DRAFT_3132520 [Thelephora ganbajun]